jgi:hypothetical protein
MSCQQQRKGASAHRGLQHTAQSAPALPQKMPSSGGSSSSRGGSVGLQNEVATAASTEHALRRCCCCCRCCRSVERHGHGVQGRAARQQQRENVGAGCDC